MMKFKQIENITLVQNVTLADIPALTLVAVGADMSIVTSTNVSGSAIEATHFTLELCPHGVLGTPVNKCTSMMTLSSIHGISGLTVGPVYLGVNGALTFTAPTSPDLIQKVGYAVASDVLLLDINPAGTNGVSDTYTNPSPSVVTVGGITAGTTFSNQTLTDVMDLMLYPELFPSIVAPSNAFSLTQAGLHEIGEVIGTLNFTASFNRGSISPAYGTSGFRAGLPNTYGYTGTGLPATQASTALTDLQLFSSYTVLSGAQSWTADVSYDIGEQPKSSKGNNFNTPLAAGTTGTHSVSITGVYPWFYNSVALTTMTKQSLVATNSVLTTNMIAEDGTNKQELQTADTWNNASKLEQYNTLSGQWDIILLTSFTKTTTTQTIQGSVITYNVYTYNGPTSGARSLRWTF